MRPGFRPDSEEEEYEPETMNLGVGHAGGVSDASNDDGDDDSGFSFTHHIYFAVHLGPFMLVIGRPE